MGRRVERKITPEVTLGIEYLYTQLEDDGFVVRAAGPAAATNPFLITNTNGTDFRRSEEDFEVHSVASPPPTASSPLREAGDAPVSHLGSGLGEARTQSFRPRCFSTWRRSQPPSRNGTNPNTEAPWARTPRPQPRAGQTNQRYCG